MEGTHEVGRRPFMPASTLSGRSVALLRGNLDDCTSEGRLISHGNCTRIQKTWGQRYVSKEVVGIRVLLIRPLFGGGIPRRLLQRVSLAKLTSAPLRF